MMIMTNKDENLDKFIIWCRNMYDENCKERWEHGQKPYKQFEIYYTRHFKWLQQQYKESNENTQ